MTAIVLGNSASAYPDTKCSATLHAYHLVALLHALNAIRVYTLASNSINSPTHAYCTALRRA